MIFYHGKQIITIFLLPPTTPTQPPPIFPDMFVVAGCCYFLLLAREVSEKAKGEAYKDKTSKGRKEAADRIVEFEQTAVSVNQMSIKTQFNIMTEIQINFLFSYRIRYF